MDTFGLVTYILAYVAWNLAIGFVVAVIIALAHAWLLYRRVIRGRLAGEAKS